MAACAASGAFLVTAAEELFAGEKTRRVAAASRGA
jgi:hypothetical protein